MSDISRVPPLGDAARVAVEWKNLWWNLMMYIFAAALLGVGVLFALKFSKDGQPLKDTLQVMTLTIVVPGFIFLAAADKRQRAPLSAHCVASPLEELLDRATSPGLSFGAHLTGENLSVIVSM